METATFAAGCFWGIQSEFDQIKGVLETEVGYTNGHTENPTYEQVCSKQSGHAEAVKVVFDPAVVSYAALLDAFFDMHDPTQLNRQGPDVGDQYRTGIYTHSDEQATAASAAKEAAQARLDQPVVTEIEPAGTWWPAEEYHQKYFEKRGISGCAI